jgi:hypothetical protein
MTLILQCPLCYLNLLSLIPSHQYLIYSLLYQQKLHLHLNLYHTPTVSKCTIPLHIYPLHPVNQLHLTQPLTLLHPVNKIHPYNPIQSSSSTTFNSTTDDSQWQACYL